MPANLTPDYHKAEEALRQAQTTEEKVAALEEMLRVIPKHKGTNHMQADLKTRLSKLRKEVGKSKAPVRRGNSYYVEPEGIGQVFLVGPPNSGKSTILDRLTKAAPKIADFPYTTRTFQPGMLRYHNVWIQLVDMPPVSKQFSEPWIPSTVRYGDLAVLVLSLASDNVLDEAAEALEVLEQGKVQLAGESADWGQMGSGLAVLRTLLCGTSCAAAGAGERAELLRELYPDFRFVAVDSATPESYQPFSDQVYEMLGRVRVYARQPGKAPDLDDPFVLDAGDTVFDLAEKIHKEVAARFQFARVWGSGGADGRRVTRDYVLQEGDVVEVHA